VEWSEDPIAFVTNALSPAKVQRVSIVDDRERVMEVVVEDKQLSLAIGKKGQNVRLAAKLTGWRIDIKSEEEKRREVEAQFEGLEVVTEPTEGEATSDAADETPLPYTLEGVGEKTIRKLVEGGFASIEALAGATAEQLSAIPGIGEKTAEKILAAAKGGGESPTDRPATDEPPTE
jgi:transcription termination/antitermination protein NusA